MPFAATASVGAFLRLSQALKCLGISKAALVCSSFYDDFVCVCPMTAMPYAASLMMWKWFLKGKCLFAFIENEGARSAWISGFASTKSSPADVAHRNNGGSQFVCPPVLCEGAYALQSR